MKYRCMLIQHPYYKAPSDVLLVKSTQLQPDTLTTFDCYQCKHKFACLVDPERKGQFESI